MKFEHILVERSGDFATIAMNRPQRRNALSLEHMRELIAAFRDLGGSDVLGIVLAGNGPVFSAGHDFADVAGADLPTVRSLLLTCTELMTLMQQVPQPVVARVHGLATAAGCQLVASADLAVASEDAGFAAPGGKGGWFCHTPMVAVARKHENARRHRSRHRREQHPLPRVEQHRLVGVDQELVEGEAVGRDGRQGHRPGRNLGRAGRRVGDGRGNGPALTPRGYRSRRPSGKTCVHSRTRTDLRSPLGHSGSAR